MGNMLLVSNLSEQVTDADLIARFGDYGFVESATMESSEPGNQSARVVMASSEDAQAVIDWLHDTQFKGSRISVALARNDTERTFWFHLDLPR